MNKLIEGYLADLLPRLYQQGVCLESQKEIQYGVQLELSLDSETVKVNIYSSKTKGINPYINKSNGSHLQEIVAAEINTINEPQFHRTAMHDWNSWIGSDECGKGDYFGALVVAAFRMEKDYTDLLTKLGVTDSKRLKDRQIVEIAKKLYANFPNASNSIILKPDKYNVVYASFRKTGKNLNDLLAWQHTTVITELYQRNKHTDGVLVDKFSTSEKVARLMKTKLPIVPVIERTGAEADLAVAAASILARFQFLQAREALNKRFRMVFPLGSHRVQIQAEQFIRDHGFERLNEVAKLHFVITSRLNQREILKPNNG